MNSLRFCLWWSVDHLDKYLKNFENLLGPYPSHKSVCMISCEYFEEIKWFQFSFVSLFKANTLCGYNRYSWKEKFGRPFFIHIKKKKSRLQTFFCREKNFKYKRICSSALQAQIFNQSYEVDNFCCCSAIHQRMKISLVFKKSWGFTAECSLLAWMKMCCT